ncbi:hypothetical protein [Salisediminibacterium halotolerans]|uniref:Uncharacterized protein n=2 Tax=Salisediminibacterium halotolerans TaxID=517425 RepID=A0A1H9RPF1_9BACI|nr:MULTISPECIES: hypothetical protein [Salisediminibacterium]RLJ81036.1 hypothetical protein BCL39_0097 [Actinophytocola xinjiangensis]RPE87874.1 hypothetical protein EDD67_1614 [Salisediminibacterium halotolerans]TWG37929.1 hypothetical protein BCL52_0097 [Salisediminibacterium halotolerans]SER74680.1 hypothetical protein SAMN05444126_10544 [Salisediminibacterium haloalkalitolerans]GEL08246.1 hypothetical protein SHA02_16620 [Salisediminibacterium halotolerans]
MLGPFFIGIVFIIIHLLANSILPTERLKRIRWFSFSGGLAVSYVFVYILPTLHTVQQDIDDPFAMESEIYFIGLLGVLMFFGSQLFVRQKTEYTMSSFWLQISFYSVYNMMVAYVVLSTEVTGIQAVFYSFAIGMHFIAVAHDMWREFSDLYNKVGRYILALGIVAGWLIALFIDFVPLMQAFIIAFISGAMILNVFKYELPNDNESHFPTFAFGVVVYTLITMSLKFFFEW